MEHMDVLLATISTMLTEFECCLLVSVYQTKLQIQNTSPTFNKSSIRSMSLCQASDMDTCHKMIGLRHIAYSQKKHILRYSRGVNIILAYV